MQPLNVGRQTTLLGHDASMLYEHALNGRKGGPRKHAAHGAVVRLGRGCAVEPTLVSTGERNVAVPEARVTPATTRQVANQRLKLRNTDGKEPRRLPPRRAAAALVKMNARRALSFGKASQLG